MQVIICAAGKGTRMGKLSDHTPKPLLLVSGKSLLEHKIDALPSTVTEVICVVNHLQNLILERLGSMYAGRTITYVTQEELTGTDTAVRLCEPHITGTFMVLMGDDLYHPTDLDEMSKKECAVLMHEVGVEEGERIGGKVVLDESGHIVDIIEKQQVFPGGYVNCGMYTLPKEYFNTTPTQIPGGVEYGLPQTILAHQNLLPNIVGVISHEYCQVTSPDDLSRAEKFVLNILQ